MTASKMNVREETETIFVVGHHGCKCQKSLSEAVEVVFPPLGRFHKLQGLGFGFDSVCEIKCVPNGGHDEFGVCCCHVDH